MRGLEDSRAMWTRGMIKAQGKMRNGVTRPSEACGIITP